MVSYVPAMDAKPNLQLLSQSLGFGKVAPQPLARLKFSLFPAGLPLGAITHWSGQGRTQALCRLLAEHPELKAGWVEETLSAYPPGLAQAGVRLENLLFVQAGGQTAWALAQLLRSPVFGVVIAAP